MLKTLLLFLSLFACQLAYGQLTVDAKVNVGSLATGGINVQGEFVVSDRFSLTAGFGYASDGLVLQLSDPQFSFRSTMRRLRFVPEARYYLSSPESNARAKGFFIGGYGKLNRVDTETVVFGESQEGTAVRAVLGVMTGNKWITKGGVVFELNAGIGAGTLLASDLPSGESGSALGTLDLRLGLLVGYRFGR